MVFLLAACSQDIPAGAPPEGDPTAAWGSALEAVVSTDGSVNYTLLEDHRSALDDYLAWLAVAPDPPLEGDAALARGINAYNAYVLAGVLANQPISSVRDVTVGLLAFKGAGFFKGLRFRWNGEDIDLHSFENKHLREDFKDPRIHAAINCASAGCPPLSRQLFTAEGLDAELDQAMTRFLRERNRVEDGEVVFSEIFSWFGTDFTDWTEAEDLCDYADDFDASFAVEGCPHRFEPYDWSLNATDQVPEPLPKAPSPVVWAWPPSPGDCPPYTDAQGDRCVQDSPFVTLPEKNLDLVERLFSLGGRMVCEDGICAPPNPAFTSCSVLSSREGCRELQAQERAWQELRQRCDGQGVECILASTP